MDWKEEIKEFDKEQERRNIYHRHYLTNKGTTNSLEDFEGRMRGNGKRKTPIHKREQNE